MNHLRIVILVSFLIIICLFFFSIIYFLDENSDPSYEDAFYTSVQIQTSIGLDSTSNRLSIRNWITVQSILAYILNISLVIYLSVAIIKV
jgi:hypothetical protein